MRIPLGKNRRLTTRGVRRGVQLAFFALFIALFLGTTSGFPVLGGVPSDLFLRTSPLLAAATMLASRTLIWTVLLPAAIALALTLLFGRVYCGWFCPMGTLIDIVERTVFRKRHPRPWPQERSDRWRAVKYVLLVVILASALFTYQPLLLLDPISLVHRSATVAVHAPLETVYKDAQGALYRPLLKRGVRLQVPGDRRMAENGALALAMLATVLGLSAVQRRFWCRYLCPLGGLLALASRAPLLRRRVTDACTHCLRCERQCKMGCIEERGAGYRVRECLQCYECEVCCPTGAVSFPLAHAFAETKAGMNRASQLSRRRLVFGAAAGAGWYVTQKASTAGRMGAKHEAWKNPLLIRPPGALPEKEFLEVCARCEECVKVCPTNTLQPALFEAGLEGVFTPIVVPRIGECREKCALCSEVCPTGAIQPFFPEEKNPRLTAEPLIIGVATIDRDICRAWYKNQKCSVCDEQCPYDAIASPVVDGMQRPFVVEQLCVGCGACERECPVQPEAAIRVTNRNEQRRKLVRPGSAGDGFHPASPEGRQPKHLGARNDVSADEAWRTTTAQFQPGRETPTEARPASEAPAPAEPAGGGGGGPGQGEGHGHGGGARGAGAGQGRLRRRGGV